MPTVPDIHRRGTRANQGIIAAPPLTVGTLYFVTDEGKTERWNGTTWETYSGAAGVIPAAHAPSHASGGSDPVTVTALAGFPGGTANFLRADGTFAAPATVGSGVGFLLSGTGNPQGVLSAAIGSQYIDSVTGYFYRKMGGASTAYGWYLQPGIGGPTAHWLMASDSASGTPGNIGFQVPAQTNNNPGAGFSDGLYNGSVTNASIGTRGGWITGLQNYFGDTSFDAVLRMRTGSPLTDMRFFFGVSQNDLSNSDDLTGNGFMIRASTGVDTGFVGYSRDASTSSVTASLGSIAINTPYILRIRFIRTGTPTLYFSVNDGTEITKTTNIPATGIKYGVAFYVYNKNATAQAVYHRSTCVMVGA